MKNKKIQILIAILSIAFSVFLHIGAMGIFTKNVYAEGFESIEQPEVTSEYLEGKIVSISKTDNETQYIAKVAIIDGKLKGTIIEAMIDDPQSLGIAYKVNNKVQILAQTIQNETTFIVTDHIRTDALLILFIIFASTALIVAGKKGLLSFASLILTFVTIFVVLLPLLNSGKNPILATFLTIAIIIPVIFYIGQGFHKKTTIALISTIITLIFSIGLAWIFTQVAYLTGISSEEAMFLVSFGEQEINLQGLLFAGIIIGMLGALDDVTIAQTSIVNELYEINDKISFRELYSRGLRVGKDHIASMINTLILVYTGASLPLLILLTNSEFSVRFMLNSEIIAVEIVRTLVGSIGLILAVPITTAIASWGVSKRNEK